MIASAIVTMRLEKSGQGFGAADLRSILKPSCSRATDSSSYVCSVEVQAGWRSNFELPKSFPARMRFNKKHQSKSILNSCQVIYGPKKS